MKTFNEFCVEAYQLDEFVNPKDIKSNLSKVKSAVTSNPAVRTGGRIVSGALNVAFNRALGLEKLTTDRSDIGPIERGLGGISAASMFAPGVSQTSGLAHNAIGLIPPLRKIDRRIGKEHEKALKTNPTGYTQMLGRSF